MEGVDITATLRPSTGRMVCECEGGGLGEGVEGGGVRQVLVLVRSKGLAALEGTLW